MDLPNGKRDLHLQLHIGARSRGRAGFFFVFYQLINYLPDLVGPVLIPGQTKLQEPNQSGIVDN